MKKTKVELTTKKGIIEVEGYNFTYNLKGYDIDLVVHKSFNYPTWWVVTEKNSGLLVEGLGSKTRKEAIEQAKNNIKHMSVDRLIEALERGKETKKIYSEV